MATKMQITTLTKGDRFKYFGKVHLIISITYTPNGCDVVTDKHPLFSFPPDQLVTPVNYYY